MTSDRFITNRNLDGDILVKVNVGGTETTALTIDGANGGLILGSAMNVKFRAITGAATLATSDYYVACSGSSTYAVTLPTAVGAQGRVYVVKSNMNSGVLLTVNTTSSQTIDGSLTKTLARFEALHVMSNGANWEVF